MEEADPNNNNGGGRDLLVSEHRAKIVHLEHKLLQEKDRYDLLQSESDFAKLSATQEVEKYKRECCCLRESVARLNEDCSMLREREAKDRGTIKSLLEEMEAKEREFREKLVELKVEIRCLESGKRRAKDEVREWMEKYGEVEAWVLRLFDENRLLKEKGTAAAKNVEGTRKVKVEEESFCLVEKGKRVEIAGQIDEEMPKRKHGAVVVGADNRGERGSSESDVDEGRAPLRKKRCVEVSKGVKKDSDSSKECSVPLQQHQISGAKGTSVKVVDAQAPLVQANLPEEMDHPQSSSIHPTESNRRKGTSSKPPRNPSIPESQNQPVMNHEVDTEAPALPSYIDAMHEEINTDDGDSEEDAIRPIKGGPVDMSILKSFRTHIAYFVSKEEEREPLRCLNHTKKISAWPLRMQQPNTRFMELIRKSSLYPLVACSYQYVSSVEISSFVERWHPETNTFHLPFGEMSITLDDVSCLLSLPVTGKSVCQLEGSDVRPAVDLLVHSLGISHSEAFNEINTKGGASVRLDWLREHFSGVNDNDSEDRILCAARAYLLYLLGCTLFGDKSGTRVSIDYLELLHDIHSVHTFAWGAGALAYLYRQLGLASRAHVAQIAGYLTLLQAWIFAHFPKFMPVLNASYKMDQPQACRWLSRRDSNVSLAHVRVLRSTLDQLNPTEVIWDPYRTLRCHHPFHEVSYYMGTIRVKELAEPYHPVRILRQFGRRQLIPPQPFSATREKRGLSSNSYLVTYGHIEEMWVNWEDHVLSQDHRGVEVGNPWECTIDYMAWYSRISRRFIGPSIEQVEKEIPEQIALEQVDERFEQIRAVVDPFINEGPRESIKHSGLLYTALEKIKSILEGCTQADETLRSNPLESQV